MDNDWAERFDYSDLIARFEGEMEIARLTWRSPTVISWVRACGAESRHWLSRDDFDELIERIAIAIEDG